MTTTLHNYSGRLIGQCAEDHLMPSDTPHPTAAEIALREHHARCQGWESAADRDAVLAHLRVRAARIIARQADVLKPVSDYSHLLELLENSVATSTVPLPAQPWKAGAVGDLCRLAARAEWQVEKLVRERRAALVPVDECDAHPFDVEALREAEAESVAAEIGDDSVVQLVVETQERVERESAAFAARQDGFVAWVMARVRGRAA